MSIDVKQGCRVAFKPRAEQQMDMGEKVERLERNYAQLFKIYQDKDQVLKEYIRQHEQSNVGQMTQQIVELKRQVIKQQKEIEERDLRISTLQNSMAGAQGALDLGALNAELDKLLLENHLLEQKVSQMEKQQKTNFELIGTYQQQNQALQEELDRLSADTLQSKINHAQEMVALPKIEAAVEQMPLEELRGVISVVEKRQKQLGMPTCQQLLIGVLDSVAETYVEGAFRQIKNGVTLLDHRLQALETTVERNESQKKQARELQGHREEMLREIEARGLSQLQASLFKTDQARPAKPCKPQRNGRSSREQSQNSLSLSTSQDASKRQETLKTIDRRMQRLALGGEIPEHVVSRLSYIESYQSRVDSPAGLAQLKSPELRRLSERDRTGRIAFQEQTALLEKQLVQEDRRFAETVDAQAKQTEYRQERQRLEAETERYKQVKEITDRHEAMLMELKQQEQALLDSRLSGYSLFEKQLEEIKQKRVALINRYHRTQEMLSASQAARQEVEEVNATQTTSAYLKENLQVYERRIQGSQDKYERPPSPAQRQLQILQDKIAASKKAIGSSPQSPKAPAPRQMPQKPVSPMPSISSTIRRAAQAQSPRPSRYQKLTPEEKNAVEGLVTPPPQQLPAKASAAKLPARPAVAQPPVPARKTPKSQEPAEPEPRDLQLDLPVPELPPFDVSPAAPLSSAPNDAPSNPPDDGAAQSSSAQAKKKKTRRQNDATGLLEQNGDTGAGKETRAEPAMFQDLPPQAEIPVFIPPEPPKFSLDDNPFLEMDQFASYQSALNIEQQVVSPPKKRVKRHQQPVEPERQPLPQQNPEEEAQPHTRQRRHSHHEEPPAQQPSSLPPAPEAPPAEFCPPQENFDELPPLQLHPAALNAAVPSEPPEMPSLPAPVEAAKPTIPEENKPSIEQTPLQEPQPERASVVAQTVEPEKKAETTEQVFKETAEFDFYSQFAAEPDLGALPLPQVEEKQKQEEPAVQEEPKPFNLDFDAIPDFDIGSVAAPVISAPAPENQREPEAVKPPEKAEAQLQPALFYEPQLEIPTFPDDAMGIPAAAPAPEPAKQAPSKPEENPLAFQFDLQLLEPPELHGLDIPAEPLNPGNVFLQDAQKPKESAANPTETEPTNYEQLKKQEQEQRQLIQSQPKDEFGNSLVQSSQESLLEKKKRKMEANATDALLDVNAQPPEDFSALISGDLGALPLAFDPTVFQIDVPQFGADSNFQFDFQ